MWRGVAWRNAWLFEKGKCRGRRNYFQQNHSSRIPSDIVYQDELVTAFRDISPQAPTHILIDPQHADCHHQRRYRRARTGAGRMVTVAAKIARDEGIAEDGYRLIMNCNRHGGQEVYHIHNDPGGRSPAGANVGA
ncbi:HIT domain-containing protein [Escherichia coli]